MTQGLGPFRYFCVYLPAEMELGQRVTDRVSSLGPGRVTGQSPDPAF